MRCSSILLSRMIFRTLSDRTTALQFSICTLSSRFGSVPSSFRMYFRAKVRPVSFRSTMRTFPKAPLPTTRKRRKWLRLTRFGPRCQRSGGLYLMGLGSQVHWLFPERRNLCGWSLFLQHVEARECSLDSPSSVKATCLPLVLPI